jgi:uncharacterized SAM-binding protein YcdF (DUF218 family)
MFLFLSKILPLFVYPLGLACLLLGAALIVRRWRTWQSVLIASTFLLLWLGGNRLITMSLVRVLEWQYVTPSALPTAEVIVVLGGATRQQSYPRPTHEVNEAGDRLLHALRLYQQGKAPHLLLSGGAAAYDSPDTLAPEAEAMADLLMTMGVPKEALWLETRSRNTYENAVESKKLLDAANIQRVILVTSAMHMPRAAAIFRKQGFDVITAPSDYLVTEADWEYYLRPDLSVQVFNLVPSADDLALTSQAIKEMIGIAAYWLRGWL